MLENAIITAYNTNSQPYNLFIIDICAACYGNSSEQQGCASIRKVSISSLGSRMRTLNK